MAQIQEEDEDESQVDGMNNTQGREGFNEDGEVFMIQHDSVSLEEPEDRGISKTEGNLPQIEQEGSP
jgi:hypothetical protein